jgi:hypothetical protein
LSSPSPNPIINTKNIVNIVIKVTPGFIPAYRRDFSQNITNDNPYKCYMVLEFKTSEGFKFLALDENLPNNFEIEEGYIGNQVMKLSITDFPPKFSYQINIPVYTQDINTFGGTENITFKVLELHKDG